MRRTPVSASLMRSMLSRFTASTESHSSSLMRASVRSRVMPALWTTTSGLRSAMISGARSDVTSTCSAVPPTAFATAARSSPWAGTSAQITCAPSRASTSAIAAPMPREAPVTIAVQAPGSVGLRRAHADHLAGHVGRAAGEQEAQRGFEVGPGRRVHEVRGGAVADLLAGRADEPLERALGHARAGPEHDQPAARRDLADRLVEELVDLAQLAGPRDARGVEDHGGVALGVRADLEPDAGEQVAGITGSAEQDRALEQRRAALQRRGLRQPESADHEASRRGVDELLVAIGHV